VASLETMSHSPSLDRIRHSSPSALLTTFTHRPTPRDMPRMLSISAPSQKMTHPGRLDPL
jgi:hypothetical protein